MKKLSFVLISAVALIAFSGCSKLADSLTVKVPVEATIDLKVPAGGGELKSGGGHVFYSSSDYNTGTDPTVLKYKDRIKGIAANGGKAKISLIYPATSITLTNTVLQVRNADTGALLIAWNFESKTYVDKAELTLGTPVSGSLDEFSTALDEGANLIVELTGDSGSSQEAWSLEYTILMTVRAGIL
jgi:hypothetical protein